MQIEKTVVGGSGIDFEIAGVNDHAQRSMNRQSHTIHQAVRHLNGMDRERAELEALVRPDFVQFGVVKQSMLFQFVFDIGEGELRAPNRNIQFAKDPWQGADMVLVPMGENDAAYPLAVLNQIGDIGNNDIDTQQFSFGEHEAGINDDDIVAPADGHAVHSELAQAAERAQFAVFQLALRSTDASTSR